MKSRQLLLIVLSIHVSITSVFAQEKGENYYLIENFSIDSISIEDKAIVDSALTVYYSNSHDTVKYNAILNIIGSISNAELSSKYLKWNILEFEKILSSIKDEDTRDYILKNNQNLHFHASSLDLSSQKMNHALIHTKRALDIAIELKDSVSICKAFNEIGYIYRNHGQLDLAEEYHEKCLKTAKLINHDEWKAFSYNNLAMINLIHEDWKTAYHNMKKSLYYAKKFDDIYLLSVSYNDLARPLIEMNKLDSAKHLLLLAEKIQRENNYPIRLANTLINLSRIEDIKGNSKQAYSHASEAMTIAKNTNKPVALFVASKQLYYLSKKTNRHLETLRALEMMLENEKIIRDEEVMRSAQKEKADRAFEKQQALSEAEHEKQLAIEHKEQEKQQLITYAAGGGLILVLAFLGFVFNRLKITKRQKDEIDAQKAELEETHTQLAQHHKETQDSINYAKRIQDAIMPSMNVMASALGNGFVLYLPKDVVAGDFFWMEQLDNTIYYAAADCTGHGVPGAMVSVVCSNALTKSLLEEGNTDTGKLLDRTRELVINQLAKSGEEVKDGMDISLCAWNKKTNQLQWSGANNPLWIVRKGANEVEETKADKQPIGKYTGEQPFTSHSIQLNEGDSIYVFTDGYQDQFGGPKGKKFKVKQLKQTIVDISNKSMFDQKMILENTFDIWKEEVEQVDDVCVIGVRI